MRLTTYCYLWPRSQAAKTSPSHGEGPGSIPGGVTSRGRYTG